MLRDNLLVIICFNMTNISAQICTWQTTSAIKQHIVYGANQVATEVDSSTDVQKQHKGFGLYEKLATSGRYGDINVQDVRVATIVSHRVDDRILSGQSPTSPAAAQIIKRKHKKKQFKKHLKNYEISNHLGNVLVNTTDLKQGEDKNVDNVTEVYWAELKEVNDYFPFGMQMHDRSKVMNKKQSTKFGFQDQEKDDEIFGSGNAQAYKYRVSDARLGRFFAVDPLEKKYPYNSQYAFSENRVVDGREFEGLEVIISNRGEMVMENRIRVFNEADIEKLRTLFFVSGKNNDWTGEDKKLRSKGSAHRRKNYRTRTDESRRSNDVICVDCKDYYINTNDEAVAKGKKKPWPRAGNVTYRIDNHWENMFSSGKGDKVSDEDSRTHSISFSKTSGEYTKSYAVELANHGTTPSTINLTSNGTDMVQYTVQPGQSVVHTFTPTELAQMTSKKSDQKTEYKFKAESSEGFKAGLYKKQ